jgi:hypothetical protein
MALSTPQAIEMHRAAMLAYLTVSSTYGSTVPGSLEFAERKRRADNAQVIERKAWRDVMCARPETVAELAAYAVHLATVADEFDSETDQGSETAEAFRALRYAALALAGREA